MAGPLDPSGAGSGEQPDDSKQVIRRARERIEQLKNAPKAPKSLQDRMLSELGVDEGGSTETPSVGKDE
jgi:hypothetical protein